MLKMVKWLLEEHNCYIFGASQAKKVKQEINQQIHTKEEGGITGSYVYHHYRAVCTNTKNCFTNFLHLHFKKAPEWCKTVKSKIGELIN